MAHADKRIMLCYFDPLESTPHMVCVGPFATHGEAAEAGACEHTAGAFWTTELITPEEG